MVGVRRRQVRPPGNLGAQFGVRPRVIMVQLDAVRRVKPSPLAPLGGEPLAPVVAGVARSAHLDRMDFQGRHMTRIDDHLEIPQPPGVAHRIGIAPGIIRQHPARRRHHLPRPPEHMPRQADVPAALQPGQSLIQPRPFRHQKLIGIQIAHPAPRPAKVPRRMGIGQHLIVDLQPAAPQLLIPRHHCQPRPQKPQRGNRAIAAAIVVNIELPHPRQHMKPCPFRDVGGLIAHDQHQGQPRPPRRSHGRLNLDPCNALPARQKSEHGPL